MSNKLTKGWECSSSQFNGLILLNMSSDLNYSVLCLDPKSPPVKLLNAGSRLKQWSLSKLMKITCKHFAFCLILISQNFSIDSLPVSLPSKPLAYLTALLSAILLALSLQTANATRCSTWQTAPCLSHDVPSPDPLQAPLPSWQKLAAALQTPSTQSH